MREQAKRTGFLTLDVTFDVDTLPAPVPSEIPFADVAPVCIEAHLNLVVSNPGEVLRVRRLVEFTSHYDGMGRHRIMGGYHTFTGGALDETRVKLPNRERMDGRLRVSYAPDIHDLRWLAGHWNPHTPNAYTAMEWWQAYQGMLTTDASPLVVALFNNVFVVCSAPAGDE